MFLLTTRSSQSRNLANRNSHALGRVLRLTVRLVMNVTIAALSTSVRVAIPPGTNTMSPLGQDSKSKSATTCRPFAHFTSPDFSATVNAMTSPRTTAPALVDTSLEPSKSGFLCLRTNKRDSLFPRCAPTPSRLRLFEKQLHFHHALAFHAHHAGGSRLLYRVVSELEFNFANDDEDAILERNFRRH